MATPPVERPPRRPRPRDYQTEFRNRLIESRLTPNAISLTGLRAVRRRRGADPAGLVDRGRHRVHRRLGLRHARRPLLAHVGQGARRSARSWTRRSTASRRASCSPRSPYQFSKDPDLTFIASNDVAVAIVVARGPRLADGLLHARPRRGAGRRVQGRHRRPRRPRRRPVRRPRVRRPRRLIEPAVYVLAVMAVVTVFQRIFHVRSELTKPVTEAA